MARGIPRMDDPLRGGLMKKRDRFAEIFLDHGGIFFGDRLSHLSDGGLEAGADRLVPGPVLQALALSLDYGEVAPLRELSLPGLRFGRLFRLSRGGGRFLLGRLFFRGLRPFLFRRTFGGRFFLFFRHRGSACIVTEASCQ